MASATKKKRRPLRIVGLLFLLIFFLPWFLYDQNNRLDVSEILVSSPKLPDAFSGFRIVLLSDGHGKVFGDDNAGILQAVQQARPDLIVYTGDIIDEEEQLSDVVPLARGLSQIAPTYYVTGNHEWAVREMSALFAMLKENGVTPLRNAYVPIKRDGASILLCGVDDPNGPYDQKTPLALYQEVKATEGDGFSILLAHRNNRFPNMPPVALISFCPATGMAASSVCPLQTALWERNKTGFPPIPMDYIRWAAASLWSLADLVTWEKPSGCSTGPMCR